MTYPGGGPPDITEVLRQLGKEAIVLEAEAAGLKPKNNRTRCPFEGCRGKAPEHSVQLYTGQRGVWRMKCHRCGTNGSYVDLLAAVKNWTEAAAIAFLRSLPTPPARPALQIVPSPPPPPSVVDKMTPDEVRDIWKQLSTEDVHGRAYLEGRGLGEAIELDLVRFTHAKHPNKIIQYWHRQQRIVVAQLKDVVGNPRGLQGRLVREMVGDEVKAISFKKSDAKTGFFGHPELIEASTVVAVAEGIADTLAVATWSEGRDVAVVGGAGMDRLGGLATELERCGIAVEGKVFGLFAQNDRPTNKSRRAFEHLARLLSKAGATVVFVSMPDEYKDVADWRRDHPDAQWPPPALERALGGTPEEQTPSTRFELAAGTAIPVPAEMQVEWFAQDLRTLVKLLEDPIYREPIAGRGEFTWCEMTASPRFGDRPLADVDVTTIRLGLESQTRATDNKPLKFSPEEVTSVIELIARRKTVHPVRNWLKSQKWDGVSRLACELPAALGHSESSLAAVLLYRWMVSAVARAMRPGAKVDTALVLVGPQGAGKSTFFSALAGEWFSDSPVNVGDKDGLMVMSRSWIVEWAELDAMRRARDQEAIKAFLSQASDHYRPPYARRVIEVKRSCVIVGTTNNREFLHDPTGNRRFWPIEVSKLDLGWVRENRAQLFAEVLTKFEAGEQWWLTPEEDAQLAEASEEHEAVDVWSDPIEDWLEANIVLSNVTTGQVLHQALGKGLDTWSDHDSKRVGIILKRLGWARTLTSGRVDRRRVYVRPG